MEFKLVLTPERPTAGELVLEAEVPLSGVRFMCEVGKCLRRSIDHIGRCRHTTLGALVTYEMTVPQQMAIESGLFEDTDTVTVIVEENLLSYFVFYCASISAGAAGRPCYPYMQNEASLVSMIDELTFLEAWENTGYATRLAMSGNSLVAVSTSSGTTTDTTDSDGCGCDGCTCGKDDKPPVHGYAPPPPLRAPRPPKKKPPKPRPPLIGNPTDDYNWDTGAARPGDIRLEPIETTTT